MTRERKAIVKPAHYNMLLVCVVAALLPVTAAWGAGEESTTTTATTENISMGTLNGIVTNSTDDGIPDVEVRIINTLYNTKTDHYGKYKITGIPAGVYTITYKRAQYFDREVKEVEIKTEEVTDLYTVMYVSDIRRFSLGGPPPRHGWWLGE